MALAGDLEEAKRMWKNTSFTGGMVIVISTFFAVSSIVSLSDTVFKWKGFILDGVDFYREYITSPISEFITGFGVQLEPNSVDLIVVSVLAFSGIFRKVVTARKITNFSEGFGLLLSGALVSALILIPAYFILVKILNIDILSILGAGFPGFIVGALLYPLIRRFNAEERIAYYMPVFISIFFVLMLAAVNIGLNKSIA